MDEKFRYFIAGEFYKEIGQRLQGRQINLHVSDELNISMKHVDSLQVLALLNFALDCYNIPAFTWQEFVELQEFKAAKEQELFQIRNR